MPVMIRLQRRGHTWKQRQSKVDEGIELEPMGCFMRMCVYDVTQKTVKLQSLQPEHLPLSSTVAGQRHSNTCPQQRQINPLRT